MKGLIEGGVKTGGVRNRELYRERATQSGLRVMEIKEAKDFGYQTLFPAVVPTDPQPFTDDLFEHTTTNAPSRLHVVYLHFEKSVVKQIRSVLENSDNNGQLLSLAEGIDARLSGVRHSAANKLTSSVNDPKVNTNDSISPSMQVGDYIGAHFDCDEGHPISDRLLGSRRLIVHLGDEEEGKAESDRYSLVVVPYSMLDIAEEIYPGEGQYNPQAYPLLTRLNEHAREPGSKVKVLWTRLKPGDAYILPSACIFHDGATLGQNKSDIVVFYEPEERWTEKNLLNNSLFK